MDDYRSEGTRDDWVGGGEPFRAEGSWDEMNILTHYPKQQGRVLSLYHEQRLKAHGLVLTNLQI